MVSWRQVRACVMSRNAPMAFAVADSPLRELRAGRASTCDGDCVYRLACDWLFLGPVAGGFQYRRHFGTRLTVSFPTLAAGALPLLALVFEPGSAVTVVTSIALGCITISR